MKTPFTIVASLLAIVLLSACSADVPGVKPLGQTDKPVADTSGGNTAANPKSPEESASAKAVQKAAKDAQDPPAKPAETAGKRDLDAVSGLPDPRYVKFLKSKAADIAKTELKKFRTIEATYKDKVAFYQNVGHPFEPNSGIYIKWYRQYTSYKILDILRSASYIKPDIIEIRYNFKYMHTPIHSTFEKDAFRDVHPAELAQKETKFVDGGTFAVVRRYPCDRSGKYDQSLPPLPSRRMHPGAHNRVQIEGWSPEDKPASEHKKEHGAILGHPSPFGGGGGMTGMMPGASMTPSGGMAPGGAGEPANPYSTLPGKVPAAESKSEPSATSGALSGTIKLNEQNRKLLQKMVMDAAKASAKANQKGKKKAPAAKDNGAAKKNNAAPKNGASQKEDAPARK